MNRDYFTTGGDDNGPLTRSPTASTAATASIATRHGELPEPGLTGGTNYWVDVVFDTTAAPDSTAPT